MTRRSLILHVGYPKTGTSSLQAFLHGNREELRRRGICYPIAGQAEDHSHNGFAFALGGGGYGQWPDQPSLIRALTDEITASGCPTLVLSSELFLARLETIQASHDFQDIQGQRDLQVVCYLRRQETFLESLYKQFVWDPGTRLADTVDAFLRTYRMAGDYHAVLSAWAGFAGSENLVPIIYEQAQNAGGCIRQFCHLLGVDADALTACDVNMRVNTTVAGTLSTEIMRILNSYTGLSTEQRDELASGVSALEATTRHWPIPPSLFSPQHRAHIDAEYMESNQRLARDFVRQPLDGFWFREHGQPHAASAAARA